MAKNTMRKTALTTIGYKVDYVNEVILITKEFGRLASIPQNKEFKRLTEIRREFGYKVAYRTVESKPRNTYEDLTIKQMEININEFLKNDADRLSTTLAVFEKAKNFYENKQGGYGKMKGWYVSNFKDEHEKLVSSKKTDSTEESEFEFDEVSGF